ncbi:hypothetical protein AVEN_22348-1 [Araneus ventricosus]|uniref:Uncharacterized protein n=1 Tax=Araneus ventricosus TaxID=182803 RepID=A0A4Y2PS25_ARAVE|nr:hypothetical protein AVEN_22348-1 [Araneus ventricosus]
MHGSTIAASSPEEKDSSSPGTFNSRSLRESHSPPSMMSSPRKKNHSLPLSFPSNQKARFPTSQGATSLPSRTFSKVQDQIFRHLTAKFRHPLVFSLPRDSTVSYRGHASWRNEDPLEQGKRNTFHLLLFPLLA